MDQNHDDQKHVSRKKVLEICMNVAVVAVNSFFLYACFSEKLELILIAFCMLWIFCMVYICYKAKM